MERVTRYMRPWQMRARWWLWKLEKWTGASVNLLRSDHIHKRGWTCQFSSLCTFYFWVTHLGMIPDHPMSNRRFSPVQCIRTNRGRSCIRVTVASALLLSYSGEASIWYEVKPSYVSTICLFNSLTCSYHTLIYAVLLRQLGSATCMWKCSWI